MNRDVIVELKDIYMDFKKNKDIVSVLKGIDLTIKRGEVLCVVGPSGAGKSTLLNIIGTLLTPTSGVVAFGDIDITAKNDAGLSKFRNENIGFVFQNHLLLPEFTALENVMLPLIVKNGLLEEAREKAKKMLESLFLGHRLSHYPNELSGGEQQRVAVARAMINNPYLLLADEPTGNLDSGNAREIRELFLRLNREHNQTMVYVTHDENATKIASRIVTIVDGNIKSEIENRVI